MPRFDEQYAAAWERFTRLNRTVDSLSHDRRSWRRWFLLPQVSFIVPITDELVIERLVEWQSVFRPWMAYDPLESEQLHITLHLVGQLRQGIGIFLPHAWSLKSLDQLANRVAGVFDTFCPFELQIGPLNAFPNALIAEVQDHRRCMQLLRIRLLRALPARARPLAPWPFLPHVTLGYWGRQVTQPLIDIIRPYRAVNPVTCRVDCVKLTIYTRETGEVSAQTLNQASEQIVADYILAPKGG